MDKSKRNDLNDREKRIHRVEKSKSKVDKHRKVIYNIASYKSLKDEDDAFDEVLDYAYANQKNKRR